jgi:hypothetical protein
VPEDELDIEIAALFSPNDVFDIPALLPAHRRAFFAPMLSAATQPPQQPSAPPPTPALLPCLPPSAIAAVVTRKGAREAMFPHLTAKELEDQDHALRQMRMFLRDLVTQLLRDRRWELFAAPVSEEEAPGYVKPTQ